MATLGGRSQSGIRSQEGVPVVALTNAGVTETGMRRARPRPLFTVHAVLVVGLAAVITASEFDQLVRVATSKPEFWLMTALTVVAATQAFMPSGRRGAPVVIGPAVCFTFAILLVWGLGPAVVAQVAAIVVVVWRRQVSLRESVLRAGQYALAFAAAALVLSANSPYPWADRPSDIMATMAEAVTLVAAVAAWLLVYVILVVASDWLRQGDPRGRYAGGVIGYQILFMAALLLLSPVLAVAGYLNVAFVPLVFVPLYAVERMARLSTERDKASRHDPLTGLANRAGLKSRFDELAAAGCPTPTGIRGTRRVSMLMLDLDRFKHVNDALGHEVGDQLLVAVGKRLAAVDLGDGMVARLGGDEFAVLAPVLDDAEADRLAGQILASLSEPLTLDGLRVDVTASIGVAVGVYCKDDFATLMRHADVAMYEAKQRGDAVAAYEPRADHNTPQRLALLTDFRHALETGDSDQIALHYQPQVSLATGQVVGMEALLRWRHPTYGIIGTQELLHIAEHTSVMQLLTRRVIEDVVAQVAAWAKQGVELRASLNISARDLYSGDFASHLAAQLNRQHVSPSQIQVEITESALMADPKQALETTGRIAALGVAVALDDFGTGYSSLQHLRRMPLSELKIDKSFVAGMAANTDDAAIVASTVQMAHSLGLRTVAEGVESEYTRSMLADIGCLVAQGWLTARAMPGDEVPGWLAQHAAAHAPA
jgi:diguanylate cyclase